MMRLVPNARHLEVQVLADRHGQAIALYGRDCSVQRRHQKIIEEGPAVAASNDVWLDMERSAVRLVNSVGYVGAGTVEYLFSDTGDYYFLELNPRLQVEHPVTEEITGVNLPASQLQVAMGIPLHRIPEIRRLYLKETHPEIPEPFFDFHNAPRAPPRGHVIAVRITGENPDEGFKPTSGGITELTFRSNPNVWGYFSVGAHGGLHEYADSQFGHVFARGATREDARKSMVVGLKEISIRGDIRTPVEYIIHLLETQEYIDNDIHTGWLDGLIAAKVTTKKPDNMLVVLCGALYRAHETTTALTTEYLQQLARGQVPHNKMLSTTIPVELIYLNTKYRLTATRSGPHHYTITLTGDKSVVVEAQVRSTRDGGLLILLDGDLHLCYGFEEPAGLRLIVAAKTCMFSQEYDPTHLRTTTPGKLVRHLVSDGSAVRRGQAYAEVEVMKMYLNLTAPEDGRISWVLSEGSSMAGGDLLARLDLDDPTKVMRPVDFVGHLPATKPPSIVGDKPHQLLRTALASIKRIIEGYDNQKVAETVDEMLAHLANPNLPLFEFKESLSVLTGRLPRQLMEQIEELLSNYEKALGTPNPLQFDGKKIQQFIEAYTTNNPALQRVAAPLYDLAGTYANGLEGHTIFIITSLFTDFLTLERHFYNKHSLTVIRDMREKHKDQLGPMIDMALALHPQSKRGTVILSLLTRVEALGFVDSLAEILTEFSLLSGRNMELSMRAKRMLIRAQLPSIQQRMQTLEQMLGSIVGSNPEERARQLKAIVHIPSDLLDVLLPLVSQSEAAVREEGVEVYIRRAYSAYNITDFKVLSTNPLRAEWWFSPNVPLESSRHKEPRKGMFVLVEPNNTVEALISTLVEALSTFNLIYFIIFYSFYFVLVLVLLTIV